MDEAPTPFYEKNNNKMNKNNENININDITKDNHEYNLIFNDNKSFKINLFLNEEKKIINLKAILNGEFTIMEYEKILTLDELITKNRQFKTFDYINEAFYLIIKLFEKGKITIKEYKENELVKLEIKLLSLSGDEQIFDIDLGRKEINKDIIINKMISKIISLEKELKDMRKENEKRDKEIESLKDIINKFNGNKNKESNKKNESNKNNNKNNININYNNEYNFFINSRIVNEKSLAFVVNELKKVYNNINENKKFKPKLLYRGSKDGFQSKIFHSKCDNIKGTLILIENNKGIRFGGFTKETWNGEYMAKFDENAFCFSISLQKIYKVIKDKEAIRADPKFGPVFLNDIFGFRKENINFGETYAKAHCNYSGLDDDFEINGGEKNIDVNDIEVYYVLFE